MPETTEKRTLSEIVKDNPHEMLNVKQLAESLDCDPRSIRNRMRAGELPMPAKQGRNKVFIASKILEHIARMMDTETSDRNAQLKRFQA